MFNNFQHGSHLWLVRVEAESFLSDGRPVYRTIPGSLTHSSLAVSHDHQFSNKVFWGICVTLKQKDIRVKYTHRSLLCLTIMPVMGKHPCVCTYDQLCVLTVSKSWVSLFLFSHRSVHPGQERMLHISPQIGSQHLSTSRLQSHISLDTYFFFFFFTDEQNQVHISALGPSQPNTDDRQGALADSCVGIMGTSSDPFLSVGTCQELCRQVNGMSIDRPNVFLDRSMQSGQELQTSWSDLSANFSLPWQQCKSGKIFRVQNTS